jgi:metal transporter CNNM
MAGETSRAGELGIIFSGFFLSTDRWQHSLTFNILLQLLVNPHHLLVALLLFNAAAYETLPIFLDRLLNPLAAILISVTAILAFGEILPQALCKRYGLEIGGYSSLAVRLILIITFPISWPVGKLLDWLLGEETVLFRRAELREFVTLHGKPHMGHGEGTLSAQEVQLIHSAMDFAHKTAETAMTSLSEVFCLDADALLDRSLLRKIMEAGHSRVPVHEHGDAQRIIGLILVKELLLVGTEKNESLRVRECKVRDIDYIPADMPLYGVLELFRLKHRHMAILTRNHKDSNKSEVVGVVTIEDVIEELLEVGILKEAADQRRNSTVTNERKGPVSTQARRDVVPGIIARYLPGRRHSVSIFGNRGSMAVDEDSTNSRHPLGGGHTQNAESCGQRRSKSAGVLTLGGSMTSSHSNDQHEVAVQNTSQQL